MTHIIQIDADEAKKKLSVFRTYFLEIIVVALSVAIIYLFVGQKTMEHDMQNYLKDDRVTAIEKLTANTNAITENNKQIELNRLTIEEFKDLMKELKMYLVRYKK